MNVQKMLIVIYGLVWTKVQLILHLHRHDYHDQSLIRGIGADNSVMYYSPFVWVHVLPETVETTTTFSWTGTENLQRACAELNYALVFFPPVFSSHSAF